MNNATKFQDHHHKCLFFCGALYSFNLAFIVLLDLNQLITERDVSDFLKVANYM